MSDFAIRMSVFAVLLVTFTVWQWRSGRGPLPKWRQRWRHNFGLLAIDSLLVRLVQPLLLIGIAMIEANPIQITQSLPDTLAVIASLFILDFTIYWQHRLFHKVPIFWRLHRVHHSDPELDVSSAVRFHPIEIILSLLIKASVIWLLGIPPTAILIFDLLLNATALFNHTHVRLPVWLEFPLHKVVVTPDMHRIHHSRRQEEADSNFGFCLSIWDRIFNSYVADGKHGDGGLNIGLPGTQGYAPATFSALLTMPFRHSFGQRQHSKPETQQH